MPFNQISVYRTIGSVENGSDSFYNAYGQPTDIKEYDYGSGARGTTVLRETKYTYAVLGSYITDKIASVQQYDGAGHEFAATTYGYDDTTLQVTSGLFQHVAASGPRGNLTSEYDYINGSTYLTNHAQADDAGQILSTWGSNPGTISYGYTSQDTLLTTITPPQPNGVSLNTQFGHDSYTGLLTSTTDPNSQVTNYKYDALLRQSELDFPDGGKTTYGYLNTTQVGIYDYQNATTHTDTEILNDGLGRQIRTAVANGQGTNPWYQNDFCPSATTLTSFSSYRYQGNGLTTGQVCSGTGGDLTTYDPLGRITQVHHGDGTSLTYQYAGRATKVTDENGVGRISQVDGLGRLTAACEISSNSLLGSGSPASCALDISGIGYLTTYSYNLATLTTTITQGAQQRQFQTDWLGRPDLVKEPESGQTTYSYAYNGTGLVVTRVRPTANQSNPSTTTTTTSQYDSLGRLSSVSYSDGTPTKNYLYDASSQWGNSLQNTKGRLIEQSVGPGIGIAGTIFSYDPMGRVIWFAQCTPSTCGSRAFSASYSYDHSGNMLTGGDGFMSYTYSYSPANEFLSITSSLNDSQHPPHLVSNVTNGPFGPLTWSLGNGLSGVRRYDGLGRLTGGWVCNGSASIFCAGGSQVYGFTVGWSGARVASSTDTAMGQGMTYGYDEFDRLNSSTVTSGTTQNFSYVYDRYGNRLQQNVTAGTGPAPVYSINTSNNQITSSGFVYDAAGNVTNDTFHSYSFDAEGNVTKVDGGSTNKFTFDGFNHRVRVDWTGGAEELIFNPVGLQASGWNPVTSSQYAGWAYWGESPVASYGAGTTAFGHQDWLGTERTRTSYNGQVIGSYTSLAFGDAFTVNGSDLVANHFTGLLHDYGSNTDHAQFRQYNPTEGRWLSPDPYSGSYDFTNPQSLNRYAYAMNSPMAATDPSGLDLKDQWCDLFGDCGGGGGGASGDGGDPGGCDPIFYDCDGSGGYIGDVGYGPAPDPKQFVDLDPNRTMTESLGLPPGMLVPSADIVGMLQGGLGLPEAGCEFGACGAGPMDLTPGQQASTAASSSDMEYDIFHCPSCANTWRQSNTVVKGASIATVVAVAAVPLAGEAATSAAGDALFARGAGLLNANNVLRIGWGWYGAHIIDNLPTGGEVFRVVVGCPSCIIHWHIWPF
jgi:RHS repeat-associated protein